MNKMKWKSLHYYKKLKVLLLLILVYLRFVVYPFIFPKSFRVRKEIVRADFIICCSFLSTRLSTGYSTRLHKHGKAGQWEIWLQFITKTTNLIEKKLNRQTHTPAKSRKEGNSQWMFLLVPLLGLFRNERKAILICILLEKA